MQGRGNSLRALGPKCTVREIVVCVRKVKRGREKLLVAVVGVLKRPKESAHCDYLRRDTNRSLQEEMPSLKIEHRRDPGKDGLEFPGPGCCTPS